MRPQLSQRLEYPEAVDVLDVQDEASGDDAEGLQALVTYRGARIGVTEALAKMAADEHVDSTDISALDDWDVRMLREWVGPGYSDDALPEFDPVDD